MTAERVMRRGDDSAVLRLTDQLEGKVTRHSHEGTE